MLQTYSVRSPTNKTALKLLIRALSTLRCLLRRFGSKQIVMACKELQTISKRKLCWGFFSICWSFLHVTACTFHIQKVFDIFCDFNFDAKRIFLENGSVVGLHMFIRQTINIECSNYEMKNRIIYFVVINWYLNSIILPISPYALFNNFLNCYYFALHHVFKGFIVLRT